MQRKVHVYDPCAQASNGVERTCPDTRLCSVLGGVCGSATLFSDIRDLATPLTEPDPNNPGITLGIHTLSSDPVYDTIVSAGAIAGADGCWAEVDARGGSDRAVTSVDVKQCEMLKDE